MSTLQELYATGQFTLLKEELKHQLDNGPSESLAKQLGLRNNLIVCEQLTEGLASQTSRDDIQDKYTKVLVQCSSAGPTEDLLSVEVTILYNFLYNHLLNKGSNSNWSAFIHTTTGTTLSRVSSYLCGGEWSPWTDPDTWDTLLQKIWMGASLRKVSNSLIVALCQCTWILVVTSLSFNKVSNLSTSLAMMAESLSSMQLSQVPMTELLMSLPLHFDKIELSPLPHGPSGQLLSDVTTYMQAVCLCQTDKWTDSIELLEKVSQSICKGAASLLTGYCEFQRGRYIEGLSILMEAVRTSITITMRLKARMYTLMGNCFSKLEKFQLSLQMYKQALSADFTYLRPLYHTANLFSKQGVTDMELESLNLLVTALEMRAPPSPMAPSLDLLQLVDTQDADISYIFALYTLASRSLHCGRYDVAAEKYVSLLKHLKSWTLHSKDCLNLPTLLQIHHEAMLALLNSGQFTECVHLCDSVLSSYHGNVSLDQSHDLSCDVISQGETTSLNTQPEFRRSSTILQSFSNNIDLESSFTKSSQVDSRDGKAPKNGRTIGQLPKNVSGSSQVTFESHRKKRKFSEISEEETGANQSVMKENTVGIDAASTNQTGLTGEPASESRMSSSQTVLNREPVWDVDVMALKYKAQALVKTGNNKAAIACLTSAVDSVRRFKRQQLTSSSVPVCSNSQNNTPRNKRQRLDADLVSTATRSGLCPPWGDQVLRMELDLYSQLGELLERTETGGSSARHYRRLVAQVKTALQSVSE